MNKIVKVFYTEKSRKDLLKIDFKFRKTIIQTINKYSHSKNPLDYATKLKSPFTGFYRFRIGNYRALFEYNENGKLILITIFKIKHRKDSYK